MTPSEHEALRAMADVIAGMKAEIARLNQRLNVAENNLHTLNGKLERLKGTHGY